MKVSLSLKKLATKRYELTSKERLMVIVAIGIIVISSTIYMTTSEVTVDPNNTVPKMVTIANKPVAVAGEQVASVIPTEQTIRDPFAKLPEAKDLKNDDNPPVPLIGNNVPNTPLGGPPNNFPHSPPLAKKDFKLKGIVEGENRSLVVIMSGSKSKAYNLNDIIGIYTITAINADNVVLSSSDDKIVLRIESSGHKEGKTSEK